MNTTSSGYIRALRGLFAGLTLVFLCTSAHGQIFVTSAADGPGYVGAYNSDGTAINPNFITGLSNPTAIVLLGSDLFVLNNWATPSSTGPGSIGEYTTSGTTVNASLISGLSTDASAMVLSGSNLFVLNTGTGTIGEYTTSGATVNASLISADPKGSNPAF
jgi:hypothetical protein